MMNRLAPRYTSTALLQYYIGKILAYITFSILHEVRDKYNIFHLNTVVFIMESVSNETD